MARKQWDEIFAKISSAYSPNILSRIASDSMCMALGLFLILSNRSSVSHSFQLSYAFTVEPSCLYIILLISLYLGHKKNNIDVTKTRCRDAV